MAGVHAMMISGGGNSSGSISCGDITVNALYLKPNGVTIAAIPNAAKGAWHSFKGQDYYVAIDYDDLVSVVSVYKGLSGDGDVLADLTRDGQTKSIPLNQVVTTFVDRFGTGAAAGGLFYSATYFNQSIRSWDTSNVVYMIGVFKNCIVFNQEINDWNVSNVLDMSYMFDSCFAFDEYLDAWNVGNVLDMSYMFHDCLAFINDLSVWCVSKIPKKPTSFDTNTPSSWTTALKPKWGAKC